MIMKWGRTWFGLGMMFSMLLSAMIISTPNETLAMAIEGVLAVASILLSGLHEEW